MNSLQLDALMARALADQEEDNAQSILEEHCSRVWEVSNNQTPSRSPPGAHRSPDRAGNASFRGLLAGPTPNTSGVSLYGRVHHKRKEKDTLSSSGSNIVSTMSYDSGVGGEDRSHYRHVHHHHHHHVVPGGGGKDSSGANRNVKSADIIDGQRRHLMYHRSDPNMQARVHSEPLPGDLGADPHTRGRSRDGRARTSAKKTSDASSNFDSGVSLHCDISPRQAQRPGPNEPSNEK